MDNEERSKILSKKLKSFDEVFHKLDNTELKGTMRMSKELDEAVKLHKALDKKEGYTSPNNLWPPDLIDYYNEKEIKENEDKS